MPLTYSDVMSRTDYIQRVYLYPYIGYNAIIYAKKLPIAIWLPIIAAVSMVLSLFMPWFSILSALGPLDQLTGFEIATRGLQLGLRNFSFPFLWLLVLFGGGLVVLSIRLFQSKVLTTSLLWSIGISFGLALLLEISYWFASLFAFSQIGQELSISMGSSSGLWVCLIITVVAGILSYFLFSDLSWHWKLAVEDVEMVAKKTNFQLF